MKHPAKYNDALLPIFARLLGGATRILDPFAGSGKIFMLERWLPGARIEAVEIEPEWAAMNPRTTVGNALAIPWPAASFDAICTSPTFSNRMADHHDAKDGSRRNTYRHILGRELHPQNSGTLQWGDEYKAFHYCAWTEASRVLEDGGRFVLNIKDHIRNGMVMPVTDWHILCLTELGFRLVEHVQVPLRGNGFGQNANKRIPYESVILFRRMT